eukprot:TRINITY_DN5714_c0_g1_i1.p2 TRINITY_DN5714_c0_g1~~TRINITY_DN5714_c0_g1_i1.p2  ORF type:complete len:108 (+),score=4.13 TRINITY_DN5714_c0_g1_i1:804-1127(+)
MRRRRSKKKKGTRERCSSRFGSKFFFCVLGFLLFTFLSSLHSLKVPLFFYLFADLYCSCLLLFFFFFFFDSKFVCVLSFTPTRRSPDDFFFFFFFLAFFTPSASIEN